MAWPEAPRQGGEGRRRQAGLAAGSVFFSSLLCLLLERLSLPHTAGAPWALHPHTARSTATPLPPSAVPVPRLFHQPCCPLPRTPASWDCARLPPKEVSPWQVAVTQPRASGGKARGSVGLEHAAPRDQRGRLFPAQRSSHQKCPTPKPPKAPAANSTFSLPSVETN